MNIQQMQYVIAVSELKHFEKAADKCFVTQSTLSTMISKFEQEIDIQLFDRKTKPVSITKEGEEIIAQLKLIDFQLNSLNEKIKQLKGEFKGLLKIGVIPTVSPFLLPLFLKSFALKNKEIEIEIKELTTAEMIKQLKQRDLDIGIASIPFSDEELEEIPLYQEPFLWYNEDEKSVKQDMNLSKLDLSNFWLLEEGHCMRTQVMRICELDKCDINSALNIKFKAGSIDSLLRFVKANQGTTLLPYLSTLDFPTSQKNKLAQFKKPIPTRAIGLVVHKHFTKKRALKLLQEEIQESILPLLPKNTFESELINPI